MANRSEAHSWPLSGFIAIRCAPMPQQLSASNQFGPSNGGAMTTGLRVWTVTGATVSVIVGKSIGGVGFGSATPSVWAGVVGILGGAPAAGRRKAHASQAD